MRRFRQPVPSSTIDHHHNRATKLPTPSVLGAVTLSILLVLCACAPVAAPPPLPTDCRDDGAPWFHDVTVQQHDTSLLVCRHKQPVALIEPARRAIAAPLLHRHPPVLFVHLLESSKGPARLHVYGLTPGGVVPIWRSSRMSGRRMLQFDWVAPLEGRPGRLVTLEQGASHIWLLIQKWDHFGFVSLCRFKPEGLDWNGWKRLSCGSNTMECRWDDAGELDCRRGE